MKKTIIILTGLLIAIIMFGCGKKQEPTPTFDASTQSTQETTTTTTTATTVAPTTAATVDQFWGSLFSGTYTELMAQKKTSVNIAFNNPDYNVKLNIANNNNIKNVPLGEYTAKFTHTDLKNNNDNSYTVKFKAVKDGKEYDASLVYYFEGDGVISVTLNMNNGSLELMPGRPA